MEGVARLDHDAAAPVLQLAVVGNVLVDPLGGIDGQWHQGADRAVIGEREIGLHFAAIGYLLSGCCASRRVPAFSLLMGVQVGRPPRARTMACSSQVDRQPAIALAATREPMRQWVTFAHPEISEGLPRRTLQSRLRSIVRVHAHARAPKGAIADRARISRGAEYCAHRRRSPSRPLRTRHRDSPGAGW
jgi:hypothetical protein